MSELYKTDYADLIDHVHVKKTPQPIMVSRSTYLLCMIVGIILALLIYIRWNNVIFAVIGGAALSLLLFSSKIFAKEYQSVPDHIFYVLFNDSNNTIRYDELKQIG